MYSRVSVRVSRCAACGVLIVLRMADACVGVLGGAPKITSSRQLASVSFEQLGLTVSGGVAATLCEAMEVARDFKAAARAPTASAVVGSDGAGPLPFRSA